jgi:hypothetical protein
MERVASPIPRVMSTGGRAEASPGALCQVLRPRVPETDIIVKSQEFSWSMVPGSHDDQPPFGPADNFDFPP